jgi:isocitrate/isopropylmalate dehydrogenase
MFESLAARHDDADANFCSKVLEQAISEHLASKGPVTYDLGGKASTIEVGEGIAERCRKILTDKSGN